MNSKKLTDLRKEIDRIDSRIVNLINERGRATCEIGQIKRIKKSPVYNPDRESQIYAGIEKKNKGPLSSESVKAIYREIMSACLFLQHPLRVAYLGPEFTFTHQASQKKFGSSVNYLSCGDIADVFHEVEKGNADYGVVPIENSTEGAVNYTLDVLVDSPLLISSEIYYTIHHSVLCKSGDKKSILTIYSNPQVFGQCRKWLEKNLPAVKLCDTVSTAKAAEIAARRGDAACIASEFAAEKYKLKVVSRRIEDNAVNVTRFLVVGKHMSKISEGDKTSIVFSVKDSPGILHDMLNSFKKNGINLTKIESRPSKKRLWKYYFFIDMEGHSDTPKIKKTLGELRKKCHFLKILGSYPKG